MTLRLPQIPIRVDVSPPMLPTRPPPLPLARILVLSTTINHSLSRVPSREALAGPIKSCPAVGTTNTWHVHASMITSSSSANQSPTAPSLTSTTFSHPSSPSLLRLAVHSAAVPARRACRATLRRRSAIGVDGNTEMWKGVPWIGCTLSSESGVSVEITSPSPRQFDDDEHCRHPMADTGKRSIARPPNKDTDGGTKPGTH